MEGFKQENDSEVFEQEQRKRAFSVGTRSRMTEGIEKCALKYNSCPVIRGKINTVA